jgi:hypothetical protein
MLRRVLQGVVTHIKFAAAAAVGTASFQPDTL